MIPNPSSPHHPLILCYDPILRSRVWRTRTAPVAYNFNLLCFNQRYRYVPIIRPTAFSRCPGKLSGYECRVFASSTYWIRLSDMLLITRNVYWRNEVGCNEAAFIHLFSFLSRNHRLSWWWHTWFKTDNIFLKRFMNFVQILYQVSVKYLALFYSIFRFPDNKVSREKIHKCSFRVMDIDSFIYINEKRHSLEIKIIWYDLKTIIKHTNDRRYRITIRYATLKNMIRREIFCRPILYSNIL